MEIEEISGRDADQASAHSFVVKLWREPGRANAKTTGTLRGRITHVESGQARYVTCCAELTAFMMEQLGEPPARLPLVCRLCRRILRLSR